MDQRPLLLQLRLVGRVEQPDPDDAARLIALGQAVARHDRLVLSPAGRVAADLEFRAIDGEPRAIVAAAYEGFLPRNVELIRVCNDWQVRPGNVPNDHGDAAYDWTVIDRLRTLDERTAPVVRRVARSVARFDAYPRRLRAALSRVDEGEREWFTSPRIDSYHTVWMQLHEDLLLALGKSREHEPQV